MSPAALPAAETLRPSPWKMLALLAVSAAFVAIAVSMAGRQPVAAWVGGGFFGACGLTALLTLVPGSTHLRLDPLGFEIRALFRSQRLAWSEVLHFGTVRVGVHAFVGFDLAPHYRPAGRLRSLNSGLAGYQATLPDTYGLKAEVLAGRMEAWRLAHGQGPAPMPA